MHSVRIKSATVAASAGNDGSRRYAVALSAAPAPPGVGAMYATIRLGENDDAASRALFDETYAAWWTGDLDAHLPGGESAHDLHARFLPAVEAISAGASGAVVLVSHGAAIRLAAAALLGDPAATRYVPNTGLVVLDATAGAWALEHWDEAPAVAGDVTGGARPAF